MFSIYGAIYILVWVAERNLPAIRQCCRSYLRLSGTALVRESQRAVHAVTKKFGRKTYVFLLRDGIIIRRTAAL